MSNPTRILYVDDYALDRELVRDVLEKQHEGFVVIEAASREEFETRLAEGGYDVVVSDFNIAGFEGLQVVDAVRARDPRVPVVIVTGSGSEEVAAEAIKRGAADYLIKSPRHIQRLPHAIQAALDKARMRREREHIEERLDMLFRAVEQSPTMVLITDTDGLVEYVNPRFCQVTGFTQDEVVGQPWRLLQGNPSDSQHTLAEALRRGLEWSGEFRSNKKSGACYWEAASISPVRSKDGRVSHFVKVAKDVTERKQTLAALQHRLAMEELISAISAYFINLPFDEIDAGIGRALGDIGDFSQVDRCYVFLFREAGQKMDNVYEWCAEGIEPQADSLQGLELDALPWFAEQMHRLETIHVPRMAELPPEACAERRFWESLQIRSFINVPIVCGGGAIGFLGFDSVRQEKTWLNEDIRLLGMAGEIIANALERKQADEALEQSEARLRQSQKMEAIGSLTGGLAHDFNNILQGVKVYTQLAIEDYRAGAPIDEDLEEISQLANRGASLTRQLLLFSRRETLEPVPHNINSSVEGLSRMLDLLIGEQGELDVQTAPDLGLVYADPGQIEQVVLNLAVNARDAMPAGGRLTIRAANVAFHEQCNDTIPPARAGQYVMLEVADTGSGMNRETQERMFEPFFTTKDPGKGSGLGLAVVYGIIKQHRGHIRVQSELGSGTIVQILLPRVQTPVEPEAAPAPPRPTAKGTETILLVEDDDSLREGARRALEMQGYRVFAAGGGDEALQCAHQQADDASLLLTDVMMPGLQGPELYTHLAANRPGLKVIYMSGYAHVSVDDQGGDGPPPLLRKPFDLADMVLKVREVLDS